MKKSWPIVLVIASLQLSCSENVKGPISIKVLLGDAHLRDQMLVAFLNGNEVARKIITKQPEDYMRNPNWVEGSDEAEFKTIVTDLHWKGDDVKYGDEIDLTKAYSDSERKFKLVTEFPLVKVGRPTGWRYKFGNNPDRFYVFALTQGHAIEFSETPKNHLRLNENNMNVEIASGSLMPMFNCFLMSLSGGVLCFAFISHFIASILPFEKNSRKSIMFSQILGALFALIFSIWLFGATENGVLVESLTRGALGLVSSVISILFLLISGNLFWKKIKAWLS